MNEGSVHDSPELQILVNQSIEVAGIHLRRLGHSHDSATAFASAHDAVHAMFRIEMDEVFRADALLADAFRHEPKGVYLAWRAYARTFVFGEAPGIDGPAVMEEAEALARHAFELDPHNATVLALISYVHSFLCRRYEAGHELAEQSLKYNPSHPLGHAFLGRAKSYLGRHDEGYRLARKGLDRSGQAPYLYTLHFLSGVTALQSGKLREAAAAAEIAIAMAPNYRAPRRYLVPLYLKLGERDKARSALEKLRELEPRFSLDAMRQSAYPSTAIREAGLLVFSDRDL